MVENRFKIKVRSHYNHIHGFVQVTPGQPWWRIEPRYTNYRHPTPGPFSWQYSSPVLNKTIKAKWPGVLELLLYQRL